MKLLEGSHEGPLGVEEADLIGRPRNGIPAGVGITRACSWNDARPQPYAPSRNVDGSHLSDANIRSMPAENNMATNQKHPSITDIGELELIRQLFEDTYYGPQLLNVHGFPPNPRIYLEVPLDGLADGDIDILLLPPAIADNPTAIQAKRIKVPASAFYTGQPNLLKEFSKLKQQTNLLVQLGFAQVYCWVIVLVDSREHNAGEYQFEGLTSELQATIDAALSIHDLDARAGILRYEFVQSVDDGPPLFSSGTRGTHLVRPAKIGSQPRRVTEWIERAIASRTFWTLEELRRLYLARNPPP